jgi:hypothetical protein
MEMLELHPGHPLPYRLARGQRFSSHPLSPALDPAPLEILTRLRLKRFRLSVDDFGTGHSLCAIFHSMSSRSIGASCIMPGLTRPRAPCTVSLLPQIRQNAAQQLEREGFIVKYKDFHCGFFEHSLRLLLSYIFNYTQITVAANRYKYPQRAIPSRTVATTR